MLKALTLSTFLYIIIIYKNGSYEVISNGSHLVHNQN